MTDVTTDKQALATACAATHEALRGALDWTRNAINARRIGSARMLLDRELRRASVNTERLRRAVDRPMCVGVFGPSQVGKSYLISALARRGTEPLLATFAGAGEGIDFVRQINPEGGEESTGLVTRFSIRAMPTPPDYPVAVRLLSQTDLVKIMGNTYLSDCDLAEEKSPERRDLDALLAKVKTMTATASAPVSEEDIWDVREYFEQGQFKGEPIIRALSSIGYFDALSQLVPMLSTEGRGLLFSMLWGQLEPFGKVFARLARKLDELGNPADAFCTLSALVAVQAGAFERRDDSIVNVKALDRLETAGDETLDVCTASGTTAKLARADLAALVAELNVTMRTQPWDFFDHTDLLDFPGARSRERIADVRAFLKKPRAVKDLFLRGKVAYLFERYNAEQELTGMLLCIGPGNQEVRTLPGVVKQWIDAAQGDSPAARAANATSLFFVLTKFDLEFEEAAGKSDDSSQRWTRRIENSMTKFFGQAHDWPDEWKPGQPFDNTFWLRNPNFLAKGLLDYDAAGKEIGIRAGEQGRIVKARQEFLENADVRRHFLDPGKAWDEAFRFNDGGITYLADTLRPVCNPEIKLRQITTRLDALRGRIDDLLRPYYVPLDLGVRREKRVAVFQTLADALIEANGRERLGSFIRRLGVEPAALKDALYRVRTNGARPNGYVALEDAETAEPRRKAAASSALIDKIRRSSAKPAAEEHKPQRSQHGNAAAAALDCWTTALYGLAQDRTFAATVGVDAASLSEIAQELIAASTRLGLEAKIAMAIEKVMFPGDKEIMFADKATIVAGRTINRFVSSFGVSESDEPEPRSLRFDGTVEKIFERRPANPAPGDLPAEPRDFRNQYMVDWVMAMENSMRANVEGGAIGSPEERAQNEFLGTLLQVCGRGATRSAQAA